jgi:hypothetical protein
LPESLKNGGTARTPRRAASTSRGESEYSEDDDREVPTDLVGADDPGSGQGGDSGYQSERHAHARQERQASASEGLVSAGKSKGKNRQDTLARDGQRAIGECLQVRKHFNLTAIAGARIAPKVLIFRQNAGALVPARNLYYIALRHALVGPVGGVKKFRRGPKYEYVE